MVPRAEEEAAWCRCDVWHDCCPESHLPHLSCLDHSGSLTGPFKGDKCSFLTLAFKRTI